MITLVNFADKQFRNKQKWNTFSAKIFGKFDNVLEFSPNDIDEYYLELNKESVKYTAKGFGNYFWKPIVINKALKKIKEGDYLMYADSGSFFLKSVLPMVKHMKREQKNILCFKLPVIEKQWTKRDAFILMSCDTDYYKDSPQTLAGFIIVKKCEESIIFLNDYKKYCSDSRILSDNPNVLGKQNYSGFIEHRHDQSVLSLLTKKNKNVLIEGDLSDYGYFPYKYIQNESCLFNEEGMNVKNNIFKGTLLSNRTVNPLKYALKYYVKLLLFKLGIRS